VRGELLLVALSLPIVLACASPCERAYKAAANDYRRRNAVVVDFARANVTQLVAATKAFHSSAGRWPRTFIELSDFAFDKHAPLNFPAFNEVTFAALDDGSVQVHYEVNCDQFKSAQYQFTQTGSVNIKSR
jgi:hypothetical protein